MNAFVHLRVVSCYSFLRAAGHPEALAERAAELGFDTLALCEEDYLCGLVPQLAGISRHLGTHLGGVIISPRPLTDDIAVQMAGKPFRVVHGDKEDVEDRLCKFDCLCLPMFGVLEDANTFIRARQPEFEVFDVPLDDAATYARLQRSVATWRGRRYSDARRETARCGFATGLMSRPTKRGCGLGAHASLVRVQARAARGATESGT